MEKRVRDIMIPIRELPTMPLESRVREVVAVLCATLSAGAGRGYGTAVIILEGTRAVGLVGIREIMQAMEPVLFKNQTYAGWSIDREAVQPVSAPGLFTRRCTELAERPVREIMLPLTHRLEAEDHLDKALYFMVAGGMEVLPVWQWGLLVGIIRLWDLFKEVAALSLPGRGQARVIALAGRKRRHPAGLSKMSRGFNCSD
ncbi:hypothetical protein GFC01_12650 [Desulfofundulus thermobenzoicus]|uniref:CBS domain-containing protein n=1 Tax=Desulfofundulus thermobenzoicus TaxID=29376 RepID=A0A6N7IU99_9FIRM|nr:CBS domain-containing protein [Desulfofundulus thermobenzoicus]MQL53089.1 hypothetical protein [Desulfofundulus thermobenzoicus]HHW42590.1 CBS domain-containing protein [Desulfotomaculum sp.]